MKKDFIVQIAPLIRLPISRMQVFSYLHRDPIKRGSLVEIPFSKRSVLGIVLESRNDFARHGNFEIKPVKRIVEKDVLSENQIKLAEKISEFYISPLGTVLRLMVPKTVKMREKRKKNSSPLEKIESGNLTKEIANAKEKEFALIGRKKVRSDALLAVMHSMLKKNRQSLCLFSEIFPAFSFFDKMRKYFPPDKIVLFHGSMPKGEFYDAWKKVKNGEAKIIVATKIGVFLPFFRLGLVAVEEPGDISHKQWDMNPRYNAVQAVRMLADIHGAKLVYSGASPSVDLWKDMKEKKVKLLEAGTGAAGDPEIKIANIFKERKNADFPIGKDLCRSIASLLEKKEKTLLVVNRRGFSNYSICRACKNILRCPHCDRALVYFEEKEEYKCLHCSHKIDLLSVCPACGSGQFSHQGVGIQMVEKKIKRLFPAARILRLDADVSKSQKKYEEIIKNSVHGNFDIIVGTQITLKMEAHPSLKMIAFPDFDNLKGIPDFNSKELIFSMLEQAKSIVGGGGAVLIQTSHPDDSVLKIFQKGNYDEFFEKELTERKKTVNPPFSRLVKIFYRGKNKKKVDTESKRVFDLLKALSGSNIDVSDPYEPFSAKKRGYYSRNILIKADPGVDIRRMSVFAVLGGLGKGWTVDVDPTSTV